MVLCVAVFSTAGCWVPCVWCVHDAHGHTHTRTRTRTCTSSRTHTRTRTLTRTRTRTRTHTHTHTHTHIDTYTHPHTINELCVSHADCVELRALSICPPQSLPTAFRIVARISTSMTTKPTRACRHGAKCKRLVGLTRHSKPIDQNDIHNMIGKQKFMLWLTVHDSSCPGGAISDTCRITMLFLRLLCAANINTPL